MDKNKKQDYHKGMFWHQKTDTKIQCNVCPRGCVLKDGQRGFCFVRQNINDEMVLTTYGRSSGFCIDPIEKKPLNHFYPGTSVLSFGTAGCNLGCKFCQNWDISKAKEWDKLSDEASPKKIAETAAQFGCKSVAFTYNDPVIFIEYAVDIAKECRKKDIKTVAVTAGYITEEARPLFFEHMDAANIDLKAFTQEFYKKLCFANLEPVLDTLVYLKEKTTTWFEITTLLIPDENDSDEEIIKLSEWIFKHLGPNIPLHFSAFHPDFKMMDKPPTPESTLLRAKAIAKSCKLNYVYVGNVYNQDHSSTYCPNCNHCLIEREWYELGDYTIQNSECPNCHHAIPGHFPKEKGSWGRRRLPITIKNL